jgi:hypothetical protein
MICNQYLQFKNVIYNQKTNSEEIPLEGNLSFTTNFYI